MVESGSKETLLGVIKSWILPGTAIVSDCWRSYECLSEEGFIHLTVQHNLTFRDPETGAHTISIEGTWAAVKRGLPGTRLCMNQFDSYEFLRIIRDIYPPLDRDVAEEPAP